MNDGQSSSAQTIAVAVVVSIGLHLALFAALDRPARQAPPEREVVELEVVEKPPPPPPPEPEPEPEPEPAPEPPPRPAPKPPRVAKIDPPPPPPPNSPPPEEPPPDEKPAPIRIGISLSSTTEGGGFAVQTGNTLYGKADEVAADPAEVKPYRATETEQAPFVPSSRLSTLPSVVAQVDPGYSPEATRERIEGQVILRVKIDENGVVTEVRVVKGLGYGLDERAVAALKKTRFKPARAEGRAVATEISYTLNFYLQD